MKKLDLQNVQETQEFAKLVAGGYVCKITKVTDAPDKEGLLIEFDICEGNFKNYYANLCEKFNFWGGKFFKSYKETALSFFKAFITAIENSNIGFKYDFDEKKLVGKFIGLTLRECEYKKNDGTIGTRLNVDECRSVQKIKAKEFEIKDLKRLDNKVDATSSKPSALTPVDDSDLPF